MLVDQLQLQRVSSFSVSLLHDICVHEADSRMRVCRLRARGEACLLQATAGHRQYAMDAKEVHGCVEMHARAGSRWKPRMRCCRGADSDALQRAPLLRRCSSVLVVSLSEGLSVRMETGLDEEAESVGHC
jgi:hypothetical protein